MNTKLKVVCYLLVLVAGVCVGSLVTDWANNSSPTPAVPAETCPDDCCPKEKKCGCPGCNGACSGGPGSCQCDPFECMDANGCCAGCRGLDPKSR